MNSKRGLIFRAIPDNGQIRAVPNNRGGIRAIVPNSAVIPADILKELEASANTLWFPRKGKFRIRDIGWIVNMCADADEYSKALTALDQLVGRTNVPVFNHPKSVMATRRDIISQRLQGIPNLTVPKCVRFLADAPERFLQVFEENNLITRY